MSFSTGAVTVGAVIIGVVAVGAGLLALRSRDAGAVRGLFVAACAGIAAALGVGVVLNRLGMQYFGVVHLAYLVVVVAVPIVGASFLAAIRWHRQAAVGVVGALMLVPAPI
ncbi:MAG: hypothetical protein Q8K63_14335, partial [Acidimicrobiales bacterium]|nr:hypothetical protein [Acidimicrobiales bacterium]